MRFFIALDIPEQSEKELFAIQKKLKDLVPQAKLTDPDKLHLTIAFLGEQPDNLKDPLIEVIKKAASDIPSFTVTPSYLDGFPHLHTAHILWIGVKGDIDKLYELRHHIKDGLAGLKLPVDQRRFMPHIAVAKLKLFNLDPDTEKEFEELMSKPLSPIRITSVKLFESVPEEGFHTHNTLAEIELR